MVELATAIAEKLIRKRLRDEDHRRLLDEAIAKVGDEMAAAELFERAHPSSDWTAAASVRQSAGNEKRVMRYRRLSYRYTTLVRSSQPLPFSDSWQSDRLRLLVQGRWRPDADIYETATTVEIVVDLAGVAEDDFEVQLFEDAIVVEGRRQLPMSREAGVYHAAGILQGPFHVELPFPSAVDPERVEARYDRGLLLITLPRRAEGA